MSAASRTSRVRMAGRGPWARSCRSCSTAPHRATRWLPPAEAAEARHHLPLLGAGPAQQEGEHLRRRVGLVVVLRLGVEADERRDRSLRGGAQRDQPPLRVDGVLAVAPCVRRQLRQRLQRRCVARMAFTTTSYAMRAFSGSAGRAGTARRASSRASPAPRPPRARVGGAGSSGHRPAPGRASAGWR